MRCAGACGCRSGRSTGGSAATLLLVRRDGQLPDQVTSQEVRSAVGITAAAIVRLGREGVNEDGLNRT